MKLRVIAFSALSLTIVSALGAGRDSIPDSDKAVKLKEVMVTGDSQKSEAQMRSSVNVINVNKSFLTQHIATSLMKTLSDIPGVQAMSIGSGQSKPAIRGLGFNRMVVAENGIKHEGQQWGEEHGLEVDQYAIDRVEVIKGPGALLYGSDAIGGVINLYSNAVPINKFEGNVNVFANSNNESLGLSALLSGRNNKFYYKLHGTIIDYADYQVPTDSIQYYSYYIKLKNRRLRNTAGKEYDGSLTLGYMWNNVTSDLLISDVHEKGGFFADAHGLEVRMSQIDYDKSRRDIDLPYHSVNHLKVQSRTLWSTGDVRWTANIAYQNNHREEMSEPISHGYMPIPPNQLERKYTKNTYTANISIVSPAGNNNEINAGINTEYQHNRRGGWGFIIPDFETASLGCYVFDKYTISKSLNVNAGVRGDLVKTNIHSYNDWYKTPDESTGEWVYMQRSSDLNRHFNSFTWSLGVDYALGDWVLKANAGKSFRVPIPKELGADGVNYNIFRYEKGNPDLSPEESYQIDAGIYLNKENFNCHVTPYFNYFPNYIYLNPTADYIEGLQAYYYTQSKVMRYGLEAEGSYTINRVILGVAGEYLYAEQKSGKKKGYTLPFSTPWSANANVKYLLPFGEKCDNDYVSVTYKLVGAQNRIVPPEIATPGYGIVNAAVGKCFGWNDYKLNINVQASNIFNKRYYDHTSYYRLIDVPEPGRNFSLMVELTF